MAEVEAVEALIVVVELLIEEGVIEEGSVIATDLIALTEGGDTSELSTIIQTSINEGKTQGEALDIAYSAIEEISQTAADNWAENMAEQGYEFENGAEAEKADFEDTDPDSDPDKGDPDTPACQDQPEGAVCEAQTQGKLSRFFDVLKGIFGGSIVSAIVWGIALLVITIGQVARWICQLIQKIKGGCDEKCTDQKCNTALCNATKTVIKFIRQFWILIIFAIVILTVLLSFLFKSVSPVFIGLIVSLIVFVLKTILGNMIATIVCDVSATTCLMQGKPINC